MLYIIGTPLGNLDDITLRQAKTISLVDIILAEDTRSATKLLKGIKDRFNLQINKNQIIKSFYKENEYVQTFECLNKLDKGKDIALISEAGMPLISDPGSLLVKEVIRKKLKFTVIPGPTALASALVHSGFNTNNFMFLGFFPKKNNDLHNLIKSIQKISALEPSTTFVAYVSIYRYNESLKIIDELIPDAKLTVCREMTKKFEEIIRGKPKDLIDKKFKGELTIVINLN